MSLFDVFRKPLTVKQMSAGSYDDAGDFTGATEATIQFKLLASLLLQTTLMPFRRIEGSLSPIVFILTLS